MKRPGLLVGLLIVWLCSPWLAPARHASAQVDYPAPPDPGVFVSDRGAVLSIESTKLINKASAEIMVASDVPVMVVTIRSVENMGADPGFGIEAYARELFNRWGVGTSDDNRGVLVLYSRGDNQVRVQLGKGWPSTQDGVVKGIVDGVIVPPIKRNSAGEGLLAGVRALGAMIDADTQARFPQKAKELAAARKGFSRTSETGKSDPATATVESVRFIQVDPTVLVLVIVGGVVLLAVVGGVVLVIRRRRTGGGDVDGEGWT